MTAKEQLAEVRKECAPLRKKIRVLLIVWIVLRALMLIIEFSVSSQGYLEFGDMADNVLAFLLSILFAIYIDYGYYSVAVLPLVGGVYTVINAVQSVSLIRSSYFVPDILEIYVWGALVLGIVQALLMADLLFNKRYAPYFKRVTEINKAERARKKGMKKGSAPETTPSADSSAFTATGSSHASETTAAEDSAPSSVPGSSPSPETTPSAAKNDSASAEAVAGASKSGELEGSAKSKKSDDNPFEI